MSRPSETPWHLPAEAIERYARGEPEEPAWASSVEAHLDRCAACRSRLTPTNDVELLNRIGAALIERTEHTAQYRRPRMYRIRFTAGLPIAWLLSTLAVTGLAGALDAIAQATNSGQPSALLLLAPVLPLVAVAAAWTPRLDPMHELSASTPSAGLALLLRRTLIILIAVVLVSAGISALGVTAPPTEWLLPCLTLTAVALALGSIVRLHLAAAGVAAVWAFGVVLPALTKRHIPELLTTAAAPAWAVVLLIAIAFIARQRQTYQHLTPTA